jgi:hypothetical protein
MPKTTYQPVNVTDENGVTHTFQAGDEVPDELVARIDNPGIWEQPEGEIVDERPLGTVGTVENVTRPPADAPYATSEPFAPFQPDSGPVVETGSTELTGEQPPAGPSESDQTAGASSEPTVEGTSKPSSDELDQMTRAGSDRSEPWARPERRRLESRGALHDRLGRRAR